MKKILLSLFVFASLFSCYVVKAQQINSLYFLENVPQRYTLNPAFQPLSTFYLGIPLLSHLQSGVYSDFPSLKDAGFSRGHSFVLANDRSKYLNALSPFNSMDGHFQMSLFEMGFRFNSNYWHLSVSQRGEGSVTMPVGLSELVLSNNQLSEGMQLQLDGLNGEMQLFTEAALGYSRALNSQLSIGARVKMLYGNSYLSAKIQQASLQYDPQKLTANADIELLSASAYQWNSRMTAIAPDFAEAIRPQGIGGAIDLGLQYQPASFLKLAVAVNDLGMLQWNRLQLHRYQLSYQFDEGDWSQWMISNPDFTEIPSDTLWADVMNQLTMTTTPMPAKQYMLSPRLNASMEIGVFDNKLSAGFLSTTRYFQEKWQQQLTAALNVRPLSWLQMTASYSVLNGRRSNIGLGAGIRMKRMQLFMAADYLPVQFAGLNLQQFSPAIPPVNAPIPYNSNRMNASVGLSIALGSWKDADKDGVSDRFDRCSETPAGIRVDRFGCAVDSDKDGIPDHLDLCPNTPRQARKLVGPDGCPLDSDGDGIPDYLDRCPDTPRGAEGFVDEWGCPIDSDGDGVYDFMDSCPDTPAGIPVDEWGCPIDTDGDGVPDYLDLCPDTPAAARGFVDRNGCLLDSDDDGVPDYLDLCPDTPIEARGFVDINGCLIDSDDDGVPDYLDECPDTPIEARGMVDQKGCPLDSDFDGIPDYLDDCPRVPGVPENNGCPEVRTEVRALFQQAIKGIQFEKDTIAFTEDSFDILNQIVIVLKDNMHFNIAIEGHSDIPLDRVMSQSELVTRSLEYALLVRKYLLMNGIDERRMTVEGFGARTPLASNSTDEGRSMNRRVELVIKFEEIRLE